MSAKDGRRVTKFKDVCLELSRNTTENKLKQLKFLLQDFISDINLHDQNNFFVDLITKLEAKGIVNGDTPGQNEALLLCEMFDAVSLHNLTNKICSELQVEKGIYQFCTLNYIYLCQSRNRSQTFNIIREQPYFNVLILSAALSNLFCKSNQLITSQTSLFLCNNIRTTCRFSP